MENLSEESWYSLIYKYNFVLNVKLNTITLYLSKFSHKVRHRQNISDKMNGT